MKTLRWVSIAALTTLPMVLGLSCPGVGAQPSAADLTTAERAAIDSSVEASGALSQAAAATQAPAGDDSSSQLSGSITFGTCPVVTISLDPNAEEGISAALTVDFGTTACEPAIMPGLFCAGNASGSINRTTRSIVLNFAGLTCGQETLTGSAEVAYSFSTTGVNLDGSFELAWSADDQIIITDGQGSFGYDRQAHASTIASFNGSISDAAATRTASFTDVVVSYQNNANLIPSGGVITLAGPDIHQLTIRFDENSPSTGNVEVSIAGGRFFTFNLFGV